MRFILLVLFLAPLLSAQERKRTCRTLFLNGPQQPESKYYLFDGASSQEIKLPRLSLSPVYDLRPGDVKLWLLTSPVLEVEEIPKDSPSVIIPAGIYDFYLIFGQDPANKTLPLRMQVVNANQERIGRGDMLWFNLTSKAIAGKVGKSQLKLPAKKTALVKEPARERGNYPVEIYFRVPNDDRTHPLIESQWRHDPRTRSIVFVFDEGNRRAPRIRSFSDFRTPKGD
ncbi:MAG: hypothetical protein AB8D78_00490 [Akkermansiaceae bacterium]